MGNMDAPEIEVKKNYSSVIVIIIAALIIIGYMIPYWYTSNPKSCARCHEMVYYYNSLQKSVHQKAAPNCFYCHVRPGKIAMIIYRVSFYREIVASFTGRKLSPLNATIPDVASCRRSGCHSINRMSSIFGDIKINHRQHVEGAKIACIKCHQGVAHPKGKLIPSRKLCFTCHGNRKKDCSMCHTKRVSKIGNSGH